MELTNTSVYANSVVSAAVAYVVMTDARYLVVLFETQCLSTTRHGTVL